MQALIFPILVAATVFEDRFQISGGYLFVFYYGAVSLAALIGLLELFALPTKSSVVEELHDHHETQEGLQAVPNSDGLIAHNHDHSEEANEKTRLFFLGQVATATVITAVQRALRV